MPIVQSLLQQTPHHLMVGSLGIGITVHYHHMWLILLLLLTGCATTASRFVSLAVVCDPDQMWEQARRESHTFCYAIQTKEKCDRADRELEAEGFYCNPILGSVQ